MAKYRITAPTGDTYSIEAPDDASQAVIMQMVNRHVQAQPSKLEAFRQEQAARTRNDSPRRQAPSSLLLQPQTEFGLNMLSGMAAAPVSGLMGIAGSLLPGPEGQGADWARQVAQDMTYQPKTELGQKMAEYNPLTLAGQGLGYLGNLAGEGATDVTGSPTLGTLANLSVQAAPAILGKGAGIVREAAGRPGLPPMPTGAARVEPTLSRRAMPDVEGGSRPPTFNEINNAVQASAMEVAGGVPLSRVADVAAVAPSKLPPTSIRHPARATRLKIWQDANEMGLKFPPTAIEPSFMRERVESMGGRAAIKQQSIHENQATVNAATAEDLRLPKDTPLDEGVLNEVSKKYDAPYKEVSEISPLAAQALEDLKATRAEAKAQWNYYNRSAHPDALKEAQMLDRRANTMEKIIEDEASVAGSPDLLARLRDARMMKAKVYDVDRALNAGDVDPQVFARILDKRGEKALSGNILKIAKAAKAFPQYMRGAPSTPAPGVSALEPIGAAAASMAGYPAVGAGIPLLRGPARSYALNKMQSPLNDKRISLRELGDYVGRYGNELALPAALTPGLGLRMPEE